MIKLKKLNNEIVKPIPVSNKIDNRLIKGAELFPEIYANIVIYAKKKSGKTTLIYKIITKTIDKNTKVYAFVSTLYNDQSWKSIREYCEKHHIEFNGFTSLIDDQGVDQLQALTKQLEEEAKQREEAELNKKDRKKKPTKLIITNSDSEDEEEETKKSKYRTPEYLIILDDLSDQSRNKSVGVLIKKNRHFKSKTILSSQASLDMDPGVRSNADYWIIFKNANDKSLSDILEKTQLPMSFDQFKKAYDVAIVPTANNPRPFLYVDTNEQVLRRSFTDEIVFK